MAAVQPPVANPGLYDAQQRQAVQQKGQVDFSEMLNNWLRWTAANSAGGVKTQEAQAEMQKIQKLIEEHTKKTELPGILAQELAARNFDEAKLKEIADSVNAADPVGSLKDKLVAEGFDEPVAAKAATKIIKTLSDKSAKAFNEHFEKMAQNYYTDSFVDPLSKTNITIDAFVAAIGGPQSLLGHFFGALYRNVKADTLKGKAKGMYEELEKSFKDAQDPAADELRLEGGGAGGASLGGGGGAGRKHGLDDANGGSAKKSRVADTGAGGAGGGAASAKRSRVVGTGAGGAGDASPGGAGVAAADVVGAMPTGQQSPLGSVIAKKQADAMAAADHDDTGLMDGNGSN